MASDRQKLVAVVAGTAAVAVGIGLLLRRWRRPAVPEGGAAREADACLSGVAASEPEAATEGGELGLHEQAKKAKDLGNKRFQGRQYAKAVEEYIKASEGKNRNTTRLSISPSKMPRSHSGAPSSWPPNTQSACRPGRQEPGRICRAKWPADSVVAFLVNPGTALQLSCTQSHDRASTVSLRWCAPPPVPCSLRASAPRLKSRR